MFGVEVMGVVCGCGLELFGVGVLGVWVGVVLGCVANCEGALLEGVTGVEGHFEHVHAEVCWLLLASVVHDV